MPDTDPAVLILCLEIMHDLAHREMTEFLWPMHHVFDSDSEVITAALVSALYFGGHIDNARGFMKITGLVPQMLLVNTRVMLMISEKKTVQ